MADKHLKFLDFVLQKLSENYETGDTIDAIAYYYEKETGVNFPEEDIQLFEDLYEDTYFKRISNVGLMVITPKTKKIIDDYGSLSKYLTSLNQQNTKAKKRNNWITISPLVIAGLAFIASIYFGISNNNKGSVIDKLERDVILKDSTIIELNNKLKKIDSLRAK